VFKLNFLAFLVLIGSSQVAYAYLDPGTGSILLQSIIAIIAAGAVSVRIFWSRILNFFGSVRSKKKPDRQ
jgi:hypothetical protein